jgi:hypothetical protein
MITMKELAELAAAEGPCVSAYLESPSAEANAAFHLTTRWKVMRGELAVAGVDPNTLVAMDAAVGVDTEAVATEPAAAADNHPVDEVDAAADHAGGEVLAVLTSRGQIVARAHMPAVRAAGRFRVGPVPWLTPWLEAVEGFVPHVVVLADRAGADVHAVGVHGDLDTEVEGSQDVIERNQPGGWSQKRYQRRSIDSWERNAAEVADHVAALADRVAARLILVGGDMHAVRPFVEALPAVRQPHVRTLEHATRAPGGNDEMLAEEIRRLVRTAHAEDLVELIERYRERLGQGAGAAEGTGAVVAALQAAMVDILLVHDDVDDERPTWFGTAANHIGSEDDIRGMGVDRPEQGRLIDVAVRAALGTGATVVLVPGAVVSEDLGALLRA